jgi:hypothetical protein
MLQNSCAFVGTLTVISWLAAIAGLVLLNPLKKTDADFDPTERVLCMMVFAYWLVYCTAKAIQPMILPQWEVALLSVKLMGVLSYLLTFTCVLSLPLHRISSRQMEM